MKRNGKLCILCVVVWVIALSCMFFGGFLIGRAKADTPTFNTDVYYGLTNNEDVYQLQEFLLAAGFFGTEPTGNFYSVTQYAVQQYQKANGLPTTGYFGPLTRGVANGQLGEGLYPRAFTLFPADVGATSYSSGGVATQQPPAAGAVATTSQDSPGSATTTGDGGGVQTGSLGGVQNIVVGNVSGVSDTQQPQTETLLGADATDTQETASPAPEAPAPTPVATQPTCSMVLGVPFADYITVSSTNATDIVERLLNQQYDITLDRNQDPTLFARKFPIINGVMNILQLPYTSHEGTTTLAMTFVNGATGEQATCEVAFSE